MKHLKDYLIKRFGDYDIFNLECTDEEYLEMVGWVEAIEEYEIDKQASAIAKVLSKMFSKS